MMLLGYNFFIKYQSSNNQDVLSKLNSSQCKLLEDTVVATVSVEPDVSAFLSTVRALPITSEMIWEATASDLLLQKFLCLHSTSWPTISVDRKFQLFFQCTSSLSDVNGTILFDEHIVIPLKLQNSSQTVSLGTSGNKPNESPFIQLCLLAEYGDAVISAEFSDFS